MYPIFFISYDEPEADEHYQNLLKFHPNAKRVHGVKGLYNAHRTCAEQCDDDFFYTVDGDTLLVKEIPEVIGTPNHVERWPSWNPLIGKAYGNASIKLWDKKRVISCEDNTKYENVSKELVMDNSQRIGTFSNIQYVINHNLILGVVRIVNNKHKWRSAFREAMKIYMAGRMIIRDYKTLSLWTNSSDVMTWLGANEAIHMLHKDLYYIKIVNDFDELERIWLSKDRSLYTSIS
jgi:hypothetical protein